MVTLSSQTKINTCCFSQQKGWFHSRNTLSGRFQTTKKAEIELNFFEYSNSKRYLAAPDIVEYSKINKAQYDIILGVKTMKEYGIILDFKDKMITVDEIKLPMRNINYL
jgi:hypothetical protein